MATHAPVPAFARCSMRTAPLPPTSRLAGTSGCTCRAASSSDRPRGRPTSKASLRGFDTLRDELNERIAQHRQCHPQARVYDDELLRMRYADALHEAVEFTPLFQPRLAWLATWLYEHTSPDSVARQIVGDCYGAGAFDF